MFIENLSYEQIFSDVHTKFLEALMQCGWHEPESRNE